MTAEWKPCISESEKNQLLTFGTSIVDNIISTNTIPLSIIHGAKTSALENIIYTLIERNINCNDKDFDKVFGPLISFFNKQEKLNTFIVANTECSSFDFSNNFSIYIIFCLLLSAGYYESFLIDFCENKIDMLSTFCVKMRFDIFCNENECKGIPKPFRQYKVVKQEFTNHCNYKIPLLYDLYFFKTIYKESSKNTKAKIDSVLRYILSDEYQELPKGYGLVQSEKNHYYAIGWDAKFPQQNKNEELTAETLHRIELLSCFPIAKENNWYKENLNLILSYKTKSGDYDLPHSALPQTDRYWITGGRKSLGENRRTKEGYIQNSTYRVNTILGNSN